MQTNPARSLVAVPVRPATPPFHARAASTGGPLVRALGLLIVCVVSLLVGGFALPGGSTQAVVTPQLQSEPAPVPVIEVPVAPEPLPVAVAEPKPAAPPKPPHPLDAAPKVEPKLPTGSAYTLSAAMDREIDAALAAAKIPASPLADDAEFLRRVTLDLTGTIPTHERATAFLLDADPYKRAKLVDELLESRYYGLHLAHIWSDLLIKRDFDSNKNLKTEAFVNWIAGEFNAGKGWDAIVRSILTAAGKEEELPQSLFYLANQDNFQPAPAKLVGATANLFMGIPLQCCECHVHPSVDKWTQQDFWGMAAFFGHLTAEREGPPNAAQRGVPATFVETPARPIDPREKAAAKAAAKAAQQAAKAAPNKAAAKAILKAAKAGPKAGNKADPPGVVIPIPDPTDDRKNVGYAKAKFFEGPPANLSSVPYRPALAEWLTASQNRYFAPAAVNRLWAHLFTRGLVHPIEDMSDGNASSHPAALKELSEAFVKADYDFKFVLRALCNTRAYQRTSRPLPENAEDEKLFSHMPVKVIGARQLLESLTVATGLLQPDPAARRGPRGAAANNNVKRPAGPQPLERFFDTREYDDIVTEYAYGVPQILRLMNSPLTNRANQTAARVMRTNRNDQARVIEDFYLMALTRRPRPEELERMAAFVDKQGGGQQAYGGVLWALLNSAEFVSNH
jgi:Protein of unknown function (DUF1549)/Protein of unknown function (DUF1553)